jgi:hypothetical protein
MKPNIPHTTTTKLLTNNLRLFLLITLKVAELSQNGNIDVEKAGILLQMMTTRFSRTTYNRAGLELK